jgi:mono/diheme cytochrome c family protein
MKSVKKHSQIARLVVSSLTFLFLFTFSLSAQGDVKAGKSLFNANCAACHKLDKKLVGPALGKISDRRELDWLKAWIKDNNALRATGDADAIAIYEEYKGSPMTAFPQLSDADIVNIVSYLDADPVKKSGVTAVVAVAEVKEEGSSNLISYVVFLVLAGLIVYVYFKSDNGFLKIVATIVLLFNLAYFGFTALMSIGVDQNYQPVQPIAFSHRIHAGDNKIDCQYCHSAAKNSKTSGIPSVNVCMNCHKNIGEVADETATAEHSKAFYDGEIQKLYKAAGWDSENLEYTGETEPIVWTRIHNLPDFAYYNHSQHVTVGGIKCQKCHGPVEEMEEVYQYSPLTMGWCIDCHKETQVKMEGNGYYKNIHEDLSKKYGVEKVTVAQMGGKECGKCRCWLVIKFIKYLYITWHLTKNTGKVLKN